MLKNGVKGIEKSRGNTRKKVEAFKCLICMDCMPMNHKFEYARKHTTNNLIICTHKFCIDCVSNHINAKVQDNVINITCPGVGCKQLIDFDRCIGIIPKSVMDRWENALSKSTISSIAKLYCPYKKCSAPLLAAERVTTTTTPKANCPHCRKDLCSKCKVVWHDGMNCKDYQNLSVDEKEEEAVMLKNLAKDKLWARCPGCQFYVEKTQGCHHITCRCGCEFCYGCGSNYGKCKGQSSKRA